MPCRTYENDPTSRQREIQRAAKLLIYVNEKTGATSPGWLLAQASNAYANDERCVTELCATLKAMQPKRRETLVYNAHDANARDLAGWWEDHQAADAERERQEAAAKRKDRLRKQALAKLSPAEREALDK